MKTKDPSIETLRGIAILLVVAGYIIKDDLHQAGPERITSFLQFLYYFTKPIRMPLFTVIAAYLYASSPATRETFKQLVTGKSRRILIPYFVVSAMQYAFFSFFDVKGPGTLPMREILKIYLWPFEQFWFLWAVFWLFIGVGLLDSVKALETKRKWLAWLGASIFAYLFLDPPRLFAVYRISYLAPFFLLGYGIRRFSKELLTPAMVKAYAASALLGCAAYLGVYNRIPFEAPAGKILALWVSFSAVPLIFRFRPSVPLLAAVGYYAFGIHIFNKISGAFPRMAFEHLGINSAVLILAAYLGFGVLLSICIQTVLERFGATRRFILGMKDSETEREPVLMPVPSPVPVPAAVPETLKGTAGGAA